MSANEVRQNGANTRIPQLTVAGHGRLKLNSRNSVATRIAFSADKTGEADMRSLLTVSAALILLISAAPLRAAMVIDDFSDGGLEELNLLRVWPGPMPPLRMT